MRKRNNCFAALPMHLLLRLRANYSKCITGRRRVRYELLRCVCDSSRCAIRYALPHSHMAHSTGCMHVGWLRCTCGILAMCRSSTLDYLLRKGNQRRARGVK